MKNSNQDSRGGKSGNTRSRSQKKTSGAADSTRAGRGAAAYFAKGKNGQRPDTEPRGVRPLGKDEKAIIGRIQGTQKGYAFLIPEDETQNDCFIPAKMLNGAMHGDTVATRQIEEAPSPDKGGTCEVVEVLKRGVKTIVGKFIKSASFAFVQPDDKRMGRDLYIAGDNALSAADGQKVVVEITKYAEGRDNAEGKVIEVLGYPDAVGTDVLSIIRSHGLYEEFSERVLTEARATQTQVLAADLKDREDFRAQTVITIDGEDAKDLDDAVAVEQMEDGTFELSVHIADVTNYVPAREAIDEEAYKRGTSAYFPDRVLPMLPRELSNGICSLNEGVDRLTLSAIMHFDGAGKLLTYRIVKGVIRSAHRMTYTAVQAILDGDAAEREKYADVAPMIDAMCRLTKSLLKKRVARGSVDFEIPECKIILDETTGKIIDIKPYPRLLSNRMIEEFMLSANEAVAEFMCKNKTPFVYRVHETPSSEKIATLMGFVQGFGLELKIQNDEVRPRDIQRLMAEAEGQPYSAVISKVALRSMQKAKYFPENLGHFGLAAKYYCHFTSPIRRYPDLIIHRIIKDYLKGGMDAVKQYIGFVSDASSLSSERERLAEEAERDVDDLKKAEFMHDRIGEHFAGVISGVTNFGIFVELENTCEGLIRLESLPFDNYVYEEGKYTLRGGKHVYKLGESVNIIVAGASVEDRKVDFVLDSEGGQPLSLEKPSKPVQKGKGKSGQVKQ